MPKQDQNLYDHYRKGFSHRLDAVLLETVDGRVYCYRDADTESARLARCLTDLGLQPGDRVTVQVEKSPQALWLYLACLRAGLVFHPLNTAYKKNELEYFLGNAEPALVVCGAENEAIMINANAQDAIQVLTLEQDGSGSLTEAAAGTKAQFVTVPRAADDLAALLYSSGTTGQPKGIMLTHANLASNASTLVDYWGFNADDRLLHALPIFHVHGLFVAIGCVLGAGASMRWLAKFDAGTVLDYLPECSVMMGVPTYYTRLLSQTDISREHCRNMRLFISGSAPLLEETFTEFERVTGHTILERYGMSETNMNTSNPLNGKRKAGTVGPPLPGVAVRVVDDAGVELPAGEIGNLQVRGPNVFKGYWRMPEKTAEDFTPDGYFNTGDKALIDTDGYVAIVGRTKDMIICGGLNVYPKEIELLIDDLDGVSESAVIGLPDTDFGESVAAVVATRADYKLSADEIIEQLKSQLANFKIPKRVFLCDELPRNTMGKVQKNMLRENYSSQS